MLLEYVCVRKRKTETDRQTDRQAGRQAGRQAISKLRDKERPQRKATSWHLPHIGGNKFLFLNPLDILL